MTPLARELTRHVDHPTSRHRCVLLDDGRRLRCLDCTQTIDLRPALARPGSTSTSDDPRHPDQRCPLHPGEWAHNCRCCRAEALARDDDQPPAEHTPTADVTAGIAACRAALTRQEHRP